MTICPNVRNHTKCPDGYLDWHAWAEKKSRTHDPIECPECGKYAIWNTRTTATPAQTDQVSEGKEVRP